MPGILKSYAWMLIIFLLMVASFIYNWGPYDSQIQKAIYLIAPIITLTASYLTLKKFGWTGARSLSLQKITFAILLWFIAEIIFLYLAIYNLEPTYSWADFFFLLGYPIFLSAVIAEKQVFQVNLHQLNTHTKSVLLTLSLIISSIVIYLGFFVAFDPQVDWFTNLVGVSWSLGDLMVGIALIYTLAMVWEYRDGKIKNAWIAFTLWSLVNIIADTIFGLYPERVFDSSNLSILLDALWISGYFFMTYYFLETKRQIDQLGKKFLPQS